MERVNTENHCPDCNVEVDSCLQHCPLCGRELHADITHNGLYPGVEPVKYIDNRGFMSDVFVFMTLLLIGGSIVVNLLLWRGIPWFLAVAAPVLYVWILVGNTILTDMFVGAKALFQMGGILGVAFAIDFVGGWKGWAYEIVLPLVLMAGIIFIDLYAWVHKSYWRDNLVYAILFMAMGFLPLALLLNDVTHVVWPTVLCTIAAGLTVLGILRFTVTHIADEMKKRFHV